MRKLKLEIQVSIDGYIARKDGSTDWMQWGWGPNWTWDEELQEFHTALNTSGDRIIISRQMAEEGFVAHWQNAAKDEQSPQAKFARYVGDTTKIVVSTTLNKQIPIPGGWENVEIMNNLKKGIQQLKAEDGGDMLVYGGATLVSSLIKQNLIDEYYLFVNPTALGKGLSIFKQQTNLQLVDAKPYKCGVTVLKYVPKSVLK
jgi:dihydrofolate reductase